MIRSDSIFADLVMCAEDWWYWAEGEWHGPHATREAAVDARLRHRHPWIDELLQRLADHGD